MRNIFSAGILNIKSAASLKQINPAFFGIGLLFRIGRARRTLNKFIVTRPEGKLIHHVLRLDDITGWMAWTFPAFFMIGGIIVTDDKTVLVRALGPTLTQFGVANVLTDPALELRNAQGTLIGSNDNWQTSPQKTQIQMTGFAPPNAAEPALYVPLPAGNYTAIVLGVGATHTGNALVEVYPQ